MDDGFDPYWEWLRIPTDRRPPNHYDLLELPEFEDNPELIRQAANRRSAVVLRYRLGERAKESQRLQQEISRALNCLSDPQQKQRYDAALQERALVEAEAGAAFEPPPILTPPQQEDAPLGDTPDDLPPVLTDIPPLVEPPAVPGDVPPVPDDIPPVQSPAAGRLAESLSPAGDRAARTKMRRVRWSSLRSWQRMAVAGGAVAAVIVVLGLALRGCSDAGQRDLKVKRAAPKEKVRRQTGEGGGIF